MPADHTGAEGIALVCTRHTGWLKSFHGKALAMLKISTHQASIVGSSDCPNPHQLELVQAAIKDSSTFIWQDKTAACGFLGCLSLLAGPQAQAARQPTGSSLFLPHGVTNVLTQHSQMQQQTQKLTGALKDILTAVQTTAEPAETSTAAGHHDAQQQGRKAGQGSEERGQKRGSSAQQLR